MATIVINLPDPVYARAVEAFGKHFNYNPNVGLTPDQFLRRRLRIHLLEITAGREVEEAGQAARRARAAALEAEFNQLPDA